MVSPRIDKQKIATLQRHMTPEVLGVVWLTDIPLEQKPPCFEIINYFFDGLLSSFCTLEKKSNDKLNNIFVTENFGKKIILAHIAHSHDVLPDRFYDFISISKQLNSSRKRILLLDQSSKQISSNLKKKYNSFDFLNVDIN